jgi:hypothetical protein
VRAIEAAAGVEEHAVINIGHPDVAPIEDPGRGAAGPPGRLASSLITLNDLPARMTAAKRPAWPGCATCWA